MSKFWLAAAAACVLSAPASATLFVYTDTNHSFAFTDDGFDGGFQAGSTYGGGTLGCVSRNTACDLNWALDVTANGYSLSIDNNVTRMELIHVHDDGYGKLYRPRGSSFSSFSAIDLKSGQSAYVFSNQAGLSSTFIEVQAGYLKVGGYYNVHGDFCRLANSESCSAMALNLTGGRFAIEDNSILDTGVIAAVDIAALETPGDYFQYDARNRTIAALTTITGAPAPVDAALPEPASWATLIAGFGVIGGAMRRRSRRAAVRFA